MGIFDKLFRQKRNGLPQSQELGTEIFDLLFDWFKESGQSPQQFEEQVYQPLLEKVKNDERNNWQFEKEPDQAASRYYVILAAYYLSGHHPEETFLHKLLEYLFGEKGGFVRESFRHENFSKYEIAKEQSDLLIAGQAIIKAFHATKFKKDSNFSYISGIADSIGRRAYLPNDVPFAKVFGFVTDLKFREKIYYILAVHAVIPYRHRRDQYADTNQFEEEIIRAFREAVAEYNAAHQKDLSVDILWDFHKAFHFIDQSDQWESTDYKKRKYLKASDFPEISAFIKKYLPQANEALRNVFYLLDLKYVEKDKNKIYKETLAQLIKSSTYDEEEFTEMISQYDDSSNHELVFNHLFVPLLDKHSAHIAYDSPLVRHFIPLIYKRLQGTSPTKALNLMQQLCEGISESSLRAFEKLKYTELISESFFSSPQHYLVLDSKAVMTKRINLITEQLNRIRPTGLKAYKHLTWYPYDDVEEFIKMNIDGEDVDLSFDLVGDLNSYFIRHQIGYQLMPIPLVARESDEYRKSHLAVLALVNQAQFDLLTDYIAQEFPDLSEAPVYQSANFSGQHVPPISDLEPAAGTTKDQTSEEPSIEHDGAWSWFISEYLTDLASKEKWFTIIPVLSGFKTGKKAQQTWLEATDTAINSIGKEQFFKELAVLMPSSLQEDFWFLDNYSTTLKGIIVACTSFPTDISLGIVRDIILAAYSKIPGVGPRSASIGNFALKALTESGEDSAFGILNILRNRTKYQRFIKVLDKHIDQFANFSDTDAELLADKSIPHLGFENGQKVLQIGDYQHIISIEGQKIKKSWVSAEGKASKTVPQVLKDHHPKRLKEVAEEVKQASALFKDLKARVRTYWLNDRTWVAADWHKYVFGHPLIYPYLEGLIWRNESACQEFIITDRTLKNAKREIAEPKPDDTISLWHPISATPRSIADWQAYVLSHKIRQPERQVFREHYPFSATEQKLTASPRFANHFLEVKKLMALANASGWIFTYVHEDVNWPRTYIKAPDLTAHIVCEYSRFDEYIPTRDLIITRGNTTNISYSNRPGGLPFEEIPAKTLSEICRDVDLFVATTSVAHNAELVKKSDALGHYRQDFLTGSFSENASAAVRKSILPGLLEQVGVEDYRFEGNFLVFSGKLNQYKVNLGSAFAQVYDSQKHLTLMPDTSSVKRKYALPIIEDETLTIIVAIVLFLKNDDQITDEKILQLIR